MRLFKKMVMTSAVYVGTCCLISGSLYLLAMQTGNLEFRDQTGTVVQNVLIAPKTVLISSLFAGLFAGVFCSGGLLGLWFLVATSERTDNYRLVWVAALFGFVSVGILFGFTVGDDHLVLGSLWVTAAGIAMAVAVKLCTNASPDERSTVAS